MVRVVLLRGLMGVNKILSCSSESVLSPANLGVKHECSVPARISRQQVARPARPDSNWGQSADIYQFYCSR